MRPSQADGRSAGLGGQGELSKRIKKAGRSERMFGTVQPTPVIRQSAGYGQVFASILKRVLLMLQHAYVALGEVLIEHTFIV